MFHPELMVQSFSSHQERTGRCLYCEIVDREEAIRLSSGQARGSRVVETNETFIALAPFAAASPFQVRIVPVAHSSDFTRISDEDIIALADILGSTLRRLRHVLGEHPWNMVLLDDDYYEEQWQLAKTTPDNTVRDPIMKDLFLYLKELCTEIEFPSGGEWTGWWPWVNWHRGWRTRCATRSTPSASLCSDWAGNSNRLAIRNSTEISSKQSGMKCAGSIASCSSS